ncbi:hypothetical protein UlMin_012613 [Ulmus minor]
MNSLLIISSSQWLHLFSLLLFSITTASANKFIPRLNPIGETFRHDPETLSLTSVSDDFETFFFTQTLDHFNYRPESYNTFQQRYVINSKYWGGAKSKAPILAYFGAEAPLDGDLSAIGFLPDNAQHLKALLLYIEHRYYGKSIPFGSRDEALKNASTLGYFNSAQAIADYAAVILHVKKKLHAQNSPVIVIGGSYGGMLASWFRLKYPHIALGALASSAPILYFDDITPQDGYFSIVTRDFRVIFFLFSIFLYPYNKILNSIYGNNLIINLQEASESCYQTILKSWSEIDKVAAKPNGLSILSKKFRTCWPLKKSSDLKNFLESTYASAAQYNSPPRYPVTVVCGGIDEANSSRTDILGKIFSGVVALQGNKSCYVNEPKNLSETSVGWSWQDIKLVLHRFASNIIFSNGLRDPYSSGGVLDNISDSIVALHTKNGSHCLDIIRSKPTDPDWLVTQRKTEVKIIRGWITQYYYDLRAFKK